MDGKKPVGRVAALVAGTALLLLGAALLVLPGPGLLLVLAGLLVLADQFPALARYVGPVRERAMRAAEESVSSPLRLAASLLTAAALLAAGVVWGVVPGLPYGGWATASGLVLSGFALLALLVWSRRRVGSRRGGGR
ncbi:PGPGW domain-containing protein [Streptomyces sp. AC627_RSS907]|uniref:PGPGW domain-containing protein n=1 Tax=Streptomyces sp. AC627_RSS907 TaxID=2823684 RepID=UPI0027E501DA|nr:PGPGW domain-containing protein [Streptomyces sp. AC627_RSS907]